MTRVLPLLAFGLVLQAGCHDGKKTHPDAGNETATTAGSGAAGPAEVIDVGNGGALLDDFRDNVAGASQKWNGKRVRRSGVVISIGRGPEGQSYIGFFGNMFGFPATDQLEAFGKVRREDNVIVEGTVKHTVTSVPSHPATIHLVDMKLVRILDKKK